MNRNRDILVDPAIKIQLIQSLFAANYKPILVILMKIIYKQRTIEVL